MQNGYVAGYTTLIELESQVIKITRRKKKKKLFSQNDTLSPHLPGQQVTLHGV